MTTVVWNKGRLVSDSRLTFMTNDYIVESYKDDVEKIYAPTAMTMHGHKVLAVATSGNAYLLDAIKNGDGLGFDLATGLFMLGVPNLDRMDSWLIVVCENCTFSLYQSGDRLDWVQYELDIPLIIGSAVEFVEDLFCTEEPEEVVRVASTIDHMTGGPIVAWTKETNIITIH